MRKTVLLFLVYLIAAGSSQGQDIEVPEEIRNLDNLSVVSLNAQPVFEIKLTETASFGDTEEVVLGRIITGTSVDHENRVYIADYFQHAVHVYQADGSYLQSVGREGRGPGDFQEIFGIHVDQNYLHVLDRKPLSKISTFDLTTLEHQNDHNIAIDWNNNPPSWQSFMRENRLFFYPNDFYPLENGKYMVFFSDQAIGSLDNLDGRTYEASVYNIRQGSYEQHDLLTFPWTGRVLAHKEAGMNNRMTILRNIPYKRSSQFDYNSGKMVYGWTDKFLFKFYDASGSYRHALYAPISGPEITLETIFDHYENKGSKISDRRREIISNDELPETWPAFDTVIMDDENRLWISTFTKDPGSYKWLVLKPAGELLAAFEWPAGRKLKHVKNGYAYTLETDNRTGLQRLVKYEIEMK